MAELTVSAVIPAHNAELYISDAIESVLSQTYSAIECIVVDDGSTDSTVKIASRYLPAITLVEQSNKGVSAARNAGIARSRGDLVAFLDADDVWLPEKTSTQVKILEERPEVGYVHAGYWIADSSLTIRDRIHVPHDSVAIRNTLTLTPPNINLALTGVVRRSVLNSVGGFDVSLPPSEDRDLVLRIAKQTEIVGIDLPLALYRRHGTQATANIDIETMQKNLSRVLAKAYSDQGIGTEFLQYKRLSYTNLYLIVAKSHFHHRALVAAFRYAAKALRTHPIHAILGIKQRDLGTIPRVASIGSSSKPRGITRH